MPCLISSVKCVSKIPGVFMLKFLDMIDTFNEYLGRLFKWTIVFLCLVMCYEVAARYLFNSPTIWAFEISTALYAAVFLLNAAYVLLYKGHVVIDLVYEKFSLKGRAILDIVSSIIFFYPYMWVVLYYGIIYTHKAWMFGERTDSTFAMPVTPVRIMFPIFAFLLLLQGSAGVIRAIMTLCTGKTYPSKYKKEELPKCEPISVIPEKNIIKEGD